MEEDTFSNWRVSHIFISPLASERIRCHSAHVFADELSEALASRLPAQQAGTCEWRTAQTCLQLPQLACPRATIRGRIMTPILSPFAPIRVIRGQCISPLLAEKTALIISASARRILCGDSWPEGWSTTPAGTIHVSARRRRQNLFR